MNYTPMPQKHGALSESADDPMEWDLRQEELRTVLAFSVTTEEDTVLHVREEATLAELDEPLEMGLFHEHKAEITGGETERVVIARDPSLPFGRAWLETGAGNYLLSGSRYTP